MGRYKTDAVKNVTLGIRADEIYGLVGESGCGKTTLAGMIIGLDKPTSGRIYYKGSDIAGLDSRESREMRKSLQMVFQDPYDSLNPRMNVMEIIREPLFIHNIGDKSWQNSRIKELADMVGIASEYMTRFPYQLSGGQSQRVCIARALALSPELIVCDEAVSALDVSVQAQILNLLKDIKNELKLSIIFVSHDLAVISHISDRIGVMYAGKIIEQGSRSDIIENSKEEYTRILFESVPKRRSRRIAE